MNQAWIQFLPLPLRSKLDGRYTLQKILSNTGWLFADRILRMGVGLVVGVWIARYLGSEQFGLFNYAIAFARVLLGAVINVLLNLILILTYGTIGAAMFTLVSYAVINYFSNLFFAKTQIFLMQANTILLK